MTAILGVRATLELEHQTMFYLYVNCGVNTKSYKKHWVLYIKNTLISFYA